MFAMRHTSPRGGSRCKFASGFLSVAALLLVAGCATDGLLTSGNPRPIPRRIKFTDPSDLSPIVKQDGGAGAETGRIIFIGAYGGNSPSWDDATYFNPKDWPPYRSIHREEEYNDIAFYESVMHVLAIQISRLFPNSVTLMIQGDSAVVREVIEYLYRPGDKIYLAGHSQGGSVIIDAAHQLKKLAIPVQMIVHMEGFLSYVVVPSNVARAFNFYTPARLALCPGREQLEAEAPALTEVSNVPIDNPRGPFSVLCPGHRNIDSDPRVWKMAIQYVIDSAKENLP
jgi:hypothetical protein